MTNFEKFKTAEERANAFEIFCSAHICEECPLNETKPDCGHSRGQFAWLDLEAEEEKSLPCPFCCSDTVITYEKVGNVDSYCIECTECKYRSVEKFQKDVAISVHNRVARAVMESEKEGAEK